MRENICRYSEIFKNIKIDDPHDLVGVEHDQNIKDVSPSDDAIQQLSDCLVDSLRVQIRESGGVDNTQFIFY